MPIIYDSEWGGDRVLLNPLLTIEEAVMVLLNKSPEEYPFIILDENGEHLETYSLEDYLQGFYDNDDTQLVDDAIKFHEWILDAIEEGDLTLYQNKLRATKLVLWAKTKNINIVVDLPITLANVQNSKQPSKQRQQEQAILNILHALGHNPLSLPQELPGNYGVKAEVRSATLNSHMFLGATVFDKAWERLLHKGKVKREK